MVAAAAFGVVVDVARAAVVAGRVAVCVPVSTAGWGAVAVLAGWRGAAPTSSRAQARLNAACRPDGRLDRAAPCRPCRALLATTRPRDTAT